MNTVDLLPALSDRDDQILRLAVAAHLARYKGQTRAHTASDLNTYLDWCHRRRLAPLEAKRAHVELFLRWMQEVRRLKPSTVSRRLSVLSGFYRTCVVDGTLEHSPAEYVRRPHVPPESPTLGLSHLQFEAMLTAGRDSDNVNDFALVAMLGSSASGSLRPPARTSRRSAKSEGTESYAFMAKATRSPSCHCRQRSAEPSTAQPAVARPARSC